MEIGGNLICEVKCTVENIRLNRNPGNKSLQTEANDDKSKICEEKDMEAREAEKM